MQLTNSRHEVFAQAVASGKSRTEAHRIAYGSRGKTAHEGGSKVARRGNVPARIAELKRLMSAAQAEREACVAREAAFELKGTLLDMQRRREIAAAIACDEKNKPQDRLAAVKLDAELAGEFIGKRDLTTNGDNLPSIIPPIIFNVPPEFLEKRDQP